MVYGLIPVAVHTTGGVRIGAMVFNQTSVDRLSSMGITAKEYDQQLTKKFYHQRYLFQLLLESLWEEVLSDLDNTPFNRFYAATGLPTDSEVHNSLYDFYNYLRLFKSGGKLGLYKHRQAEWKGPIVRLSRSDCPSPRLDIIADKIFIYRGMSVAEFDSKIFGQSWTTDIQVAKKFATDTYEDQRDGVVAVTNLNKSGIIHIFTDDPESEVVIDSASIKSAHIFNA